MVHKIAFFLLDKHFTDEIKFPHNFNWTSSCEVVTWVFNKCRLDVRPLLAVYQRKSQLVQIDKKSESGWWSYWGCSDKRLILWLISLNCEIPRFDYSQICCFLLLVSKSDWGIQLSIRLNAAVLQIAHGNNVIQFTMCNGILNILNNSGFRV